MLLETVRQHAGPAVGSAAQPRVGADYASSRRRAATPLVITGGGEPLLRDDAVVDLVARGRNFFPEVACFTNGTGLTPGLARRLVLAGFSYHCYSRQLEDNGHCRRLMGATAPTLDAFISAAGGLSQHLGGQQTQCGLAWGVRPSAG